MQQKTGTSPPRGVSEPTTLGVFSDFSHHPGKPVSGGQDLQKSHRHSNSTTTCGASAFLGHVDAVPERTANRRVILAIFDPYCRAPSGSENQQQQLALQSNSIC